MDNKTKLASLTFFSCFILSVMSISSNAQIFQGQGTGVIQQQGQIMTAPGTGATISQGASNSFGNNFGFGNLFRNNVGRHGITQIQATNVVQQQSQIMTGPTGNFGNVVINTGNTTPRTPIYRPVHRPTYRPTPRVIRQPIVRKPIVRQPIVRQPVRPITDCNFTNYNFFFTAFARPAYFQDLRRIPTRSQFDSSQYFCEFQSANHAYDDGFHYGQGAGFEAAYLSYEDTCDAFYTPPTADDDSDFIHPTPSLICRDGEYKALVRGQWTCQAIITCSANQIKVFQDDRYICINRPTPNPEPRVCSEEARRCADGSYVSRDPNNNCQFRPCPITNPEPQPIACPLDARRCADGTFVGRDPNNNCRFRPCPVAVRPTPSFIRPNIAVASSFNNNQIQSENSNSNVNNVQVETLN